MNNNYTREQIVEAISYWKTLLKESKDDEITGIGVPENLLWEAGESLKAISEILHGNADPNASTFISQIDKIIQDFESFSDAITPFTKSDDEFYNPPADDGNLPF